MRGRYNSNTGKYEVDNIVVHRDMSGKDTKEYIDNKKKSELRETFLERYAKQLKVKKADLLKNILENNSFERFYSCETYADFSLLKQTLVVENSARKSVIETLDTLDQYTRAFSRYYKHTIGRN